MAHIIDTITTPTDKKWEFVIKKQGLFDNVSLRTNYINDRKPVEQRDDNKILAEDDMALYDKYLKSAIADMNIMLARYYQREFDDYEIDDENIYLSLSLVLTVKHSVSFSLREYIVEFLELYVLKRWFGTESNTLGIDAELAAVESKLKSAINYRSIPSRRPIHPMF